MWKAAISERFVDIYMLASGGILATTPAWSKWIGHVHDIAGMLAAVCGAVLGIGAVYHMLTKKRGPQKPQDKQVKPSEGDTTRE